jgi:uncharacterized membrane protein
MVRLILRDIITRLNIMKNLKPIFVRAFALALAGMGVLQLAYQTVLAGRPSPNSIPWLDLFFANAMGVVLILTAAFLFIGRNAKAGLITIAVFTLLWCVVRNLFAVVVNADAGVVLTNFGKGITLASACLLMVYDQATEHRTQLRLSNNYILVNLCRYCIAVFLIIAGIQHFMFAAFVKFLVPAWIPGALFWTYLSGAGLIVCGLGLITSVGYKLAALAGGVVIMIWFFVLHIPRAVVGGLASPNELTACCEALAFSCALLVIHHHARQSAGRKVVQTI